MRRSSRKRKLDYHNAWKQITKVIKPKLSDEQLEKIKKIKTQKE
jgi:hypothetical protein